jgi:hypothetical protein
MARNSFHAQALIAIDQLSEYIGARHVTARMSVSLPTAEGANRPPQRMPPAGGNDGKLSRFKRRESEIERRRGGRAHAQHLIQVHQPLTTPGVVD